MRIKLIVVVLGVAFASSMYAQGEQKELEQKAEKLFRGDNFSQSLALYSQLLSLDPTNYDYNFKYGVCLIPTDIDPSEPVKYLEYASKKPEDVRVWYYLGRAYHLNYQFADAIKAYDRFAKSADTKTREKFNDVKRQIAMCENGKKLLSSIKDIRVIEKTETSAKEFFRSYELEDIGGRILATPEELLSAADKKSNSRSLIHFPGNQATLYFSSFGKDNNRDLYIVNRLSNGNYGTPEKLKGGVNTPYDEDYPFMHPNGRILYFCSKGHNSMGGYDVFRSEYNSSTNTFGPAVNLDFAINTPDDDLFYIADSSSNTAYFASSRSSSADRMHVYKVKVESVPLNLAIIKGSFASEFTSDSKDAKIIVEDAATNSRIGVFQTNPDNGDYVINLPKTGKYKFHVEAKNSKLVHTGIVDIPAFQERRAFRQEMELKADGVTEKLIIKNLFDEIVDEDVIALAQDLLKKQAELEVNFDPSTEPLASLRENNISNVYTDAGFSAELGNEQTLDQLDERILSLEKMADSFDLAKVKSLNMALEKEKLSQENMQKAEDLFSQMQDATNEESRDKLALESMKLNEEARQLADEARIAIELADFLDNESQKIDDKVVQSSDNVRVIKNAIENDDYEIALEKLKAEKLANDEDLKENPFDVLETQSNEQTALLSKSQNFANNLKLEKDELDAKIKSREKQLANATKKKDKEEISNNLEMMKLDRAEYEDQISKATKDLVDHQEYVASVRGQVDLMDRMIGNPSSVQVKINKAEYTSDEKDKMLHNLSLIADRGTFVAIDPGEIQAIMNKRPDLMAAYFEDPEALARFQKRFNIKSLPVEANSEIVEEENVELDSELVEQDQNTVTQKLQPDNVQANGKVSTSVAFDSFENDQVIDWIDPERNKRLAQIEELETDPVKRTEEKIFTQQAFLNAVEGKISELKSDYEESAIEEEVYNTNLAFLQELKADHEETLFQKNQELLQLTTAIKGSEEVISEVFPNDDALPTEQIIENPTDELLSVNTEKTEELRELERIQFELSEALISLDTQNLSEPEELEERIKIRSNYLDVVDETIIKKKLIIEKEDPENQTELYREIAQLEETRSTLENEIQTDRGNLESLGVSVVIPEDLSESTNAKALVETNQPEVDEIAQVLKEENRVVDDIPVSKPLPQSIEEVSEVKKEIKEKALQKLLRNNTEIIQLDNLINEKVKAARNSTNIIERNSLSQEAIDMTTRKNYLVHESTQIAEDLTNLDSWEEIMKAQIEVADGSRIVSTEKEQVKVISESGYKNFNYRSLEANFAYKDREQDLAELSSLYSSGDEPGILAKEIEIGEKFGLANKSEYEFYKNQNNYLVSKRTTQSTLITTLADELSQEAERLISATEALRVSASAMSNGNRKNALLKEAYAKEILAIDKIIKAKNLNEGVVNEDADLAAVTQDQFLKETYNLADIPKENYLDLEQLQEKYVSNENEIVQVPASESNSTINNSHYDSFEIDELDLNDVDFVSAESIKNLMLELNYSSDDQQRALANSDHKQFLTNKVRQKTLLSQRRAEQLALDKVDKQIKEQEILIADLISEIESENDPAIAEQKQKEKDRLQSEIQVLYRYANQGRENLTRIDNELVEIENELRILEPIAVNNLDGRITESANTTTASDRIPENSNVSRNPSGITNRITGETFVIDRFEIPANLEEEIFFIGNPTISPYSESNPIPVDVSLPAGLVFQVQVGAFRNRINQDLFKGFAPLIGDKLPSGITRYTVGLFKIFDTANDAKKEVRNLGYSDAFVVAFYDGERIPLNIARAMLDEDTVNKFNEIADNAKPAVDSNTSNQGQNAIIENNSSEDGYSVNDTKNNNSEIISSTKVPIRAPVIPDYTKKTIDELLAEEFVPTEVAADYYDDPDAAEAHQVELIGGMFYTVQVGVYSKPVPPEKIYNISPLNSQLTPGGLIKYSSGIFTSIEVAKKWRDQVVDKGVGDAFITAYYNGNRITVKQATNLVDEHGNDVLTNYESVSQSDKDETREVVWELISVSELLDEEVAGITFKIRMGPYKDEVPAKEAGAILEFRQNVEIRNNENGAISYLTKEQMNFSEAKRWKDQFLIAGINSACIVAFENGVEISLERAFEILLQ